MNYLQRETAKAKAIQAARSTETLVTAQAALDRAKARYANDGGKSAAYDIARATDRVSAAKARINARFQTLAEFAATPNGQEYMSLIPDADLVAERASRDAARVAPRHPDQPYYEAWRFVPVG